MNQLQQAFTRLQQYPHGEQVGRRILQLWDLTQKPEKEHLVPSVNQILKAIELREKEFLNRTDLQLFQEGRILPELCQAMKLATEEEWGNFKREINLSPFHSHDIERILADASGLLRNTNFEGWVLGAIETPMDPETIIDKATILNKES